MARQEGKRSVFISYAQEDLRFAKKLRRHFLGDLNLPPWIAVTELFGAQDFRIEIKRAIQEASALVVLSPSSVKSKWVRQEVKWAIAAKVPIIPAVVQRVAVPRLLATRQCVDFTNQRKGWLQLGASVINATAKSKRNWLELRAAFELDDNGDPIFAKDNELKILLHLENLPSGAEKVRYEIHHDEFDPGVWYKWKPENGFQTSMQSYGNVLISAQVATRKQTHVLSTTLYAAYSRGRRYPIGQISSKPDKAVLTAGYRGSGN
jgi:hypothetical protein